MKEQMIKAMTSKLAEVIEASDAVEVVLDEIEKDVAEGKKAIAELEQTIQAKKEALNMITELGELKLAQQEIKSLEMDVGLLQQVNTNKTHKMYPVIGDKAEEFFKVHRSATDMFKTVDDYFLLYTGLAEVSANKEMLQGFAMQLDVAFMGVKEIVIVYGLYTPISNSKFFRGTNLGQTTTLTQLKEFASEVQTYINDLRRAGKQIPSVSI